MVRWHQQFDGPEFEQALGDGDGQGSLACCNPLGRKELDTTEPMNRIEVLTEDVVILQITTFNFSISVSVVF